MVNLQQFLVHGDFRGSLVSLESNKNIPFDIKRVYYIYNTQSDIVRGYHAHKDLEQMLVCVSGSCRIKLDNGKETEFAVLDSPDKGLLIGSMIWREMMDFSSDCVLMVLANNHYDEEDYIRDYDEFLKLSK